ncbi:hypothetical protein SEUCBS139899_006349 [Sporothrix eucalyptigena]
MPSAIDQLEVVPLHPSFCAEVRDIDFSQPIPPHVIAQVQEALDQYGVLVFRKTGIVDDRVQIDFAAQFGPLDDMEPHIKAGRKMRLPDKEMFDVSNLDPEGNLVTELDPQRLGAMKGNALWHADLAFNAPRAHVSILRAHQLPPAGLGGETLYLDARAAYDDLPEATKARIQNLVGNHSMMHNRKLAAPDIYEAINVRDFAFSKHKLVVPHRNGRNTLYITSYIHHIDGWDEEKSDVDNEAATVELVDELFRHADQPKYTYLMPWINDTDFIMWDNTAVLHRATGGPYLTKHVRDMRRTTSHDVGKHGMGMNKEAFRQGLPIAKS